MSNIFDDENKKNNSEAPEDFVLFNSDLDDDLGADSSRNSNLMDEEVVNFDEIKMDNQDSESSDEELGNTEQLNLDEIESKLGTVKSGYDYNDNDEYYEDDEDYEDEDDDDDEYYDDDEDYDDDDDDDDDDYDDDDLQDEPSKPSKFSLFIKNHKGLSIVALIVVLALFITGVSYGIISYVNPTRNYIQSTANKENVMSVIDVNGTVEIGTKYKVTSLVAGKVIGSEFEIGDEVKQGDVIYKIDDTDAKLTVERAQNELAKANAATNTPTTTNARIVAVSDGIIKSLNIKQGSTVTAGGQVGTIEKEDGSVTSITTYVSGKVGILSVRVGQAVKVGQLIASLTSSDDKKEDPKYGQKSSEIDVQAAQRNLENYTIKAPVTGVIAEKNINVGDNVGVTDANNPMMVIIDKSKLAFSFKVDDKKVLEIRKGQDVTITSESVPDTTFSGKVSFVSTEGEMNDKGTPEYEVKVEIPEPGELRSGMSVKGKVITASVNKAVVVPQDALIKSDGKKALVLVKQDEFLTNDERFAKQSMENRLAFSDLKVPRGCYLVTVEYGISDGTSVEIISGLRVGDPVIYDPKHIEPFVTSEKARQASEKTEKSSKTLKTKNENGGEQSSGAQEKKSVTSEV